jgi:hypothetical protein
MKKPRWVGTSIDGDSLYIHVRLSAGGQEEVGLRESLDVVRQSGKVGCEGSLRCEIWAERTFLWGQLLTFSSGDGLKQRQSGPRVCRNIRTSLQWVHQTIDEAYHGHGTGLPRSLYFD